MPTGTVTFLLTDIEGSTARWERSGGAFTTALKRHHAFLREIVAEREGREVKDLGDGFLFAFASAGSALEAAIAGQKALTASEEALPVRMALHTGDVEPEKGDYHSLVINHASRVLLAAHGGQILCSETTAGLLRTLPEPDVELTDLGVFRLRGLTAPQRLFQVTYPEMSRQEYPPPLAEPVDTGRLPQPLTRFFGREAEGSHLEALLIQPDTRLVTLVGPGGTGKTRLSLSVAERLRPHYRGAVWFVSLADLGAADLIADAIRAGLGLAPVPNRDPLEQAAEFLSRQPSLLVLDNVEHLVDEGADLVLTLLDAVSDLTCLVTSRRVLGIAGEREYPVSPLPVPDLPPQPPSPRGKGESGPGLMRSPPFPVGKGRVPATRVAGG